MRKIEVGEYIRTKKGVIRKVKTIKTGKRDFSLTQQTLINGKYKIEEIVNHSFEPIDLIEAGDVINYYSNYSGKEIKMEVDYVCCKKDDYKWGLGYASTHYDDYVYIEDIKSIVTKEQFSNIEYKVVE